MNRLPVSTPILLDHARGAFTAFQVLGWWRARIR